MLRAAVRIGLMAGSLWLIPIELPAQYPGQQPGTTSPGGYPGGGGMGLPKISLPKRNKKTDPAKTPEIPLKSTEGNLRELGEKRLVIETASKVTIAYDLDANTAFLGKDGKPMRDSLLRPGDELRVDVNPENEKVAVKVVLVKEGARNGTESKAAGKDAEPAEAPTDPANEKTTTIRQAPESSEDDRPVLKRGGAYSKARAAKRATEADEEEASTTNIPAAQTNPAQGPAGSASTTKAPDTYSEEASLQDAGGDPVIAQARKVVHEFSNTLPNFLVHQQTTRYITEGHPVSWRALDVLSAEVVVVNGKEEYRKLTINGKTAKEGAEKSGSWSTGEFAITQQDILSPSSAATFVKRGPDRINGRVTLMYGYSVEQAHSHWQLISDDRKIYRPGYAGKIWIDKETHRVVRIEQHSVNVPEEFPFDKAEVTLEYDYVRLGTTPYLLPVHSENLICQRGTAVCTRNELDFRNYKMYGAESSIQFEPIAPKKK